MAKARRCAQVWLIITTPASLRRVGASPPNARVRHFHAFEKFTGNFASLALKWSIAGSPKERLICPTECQFFVGLPSSATDVSAEPSAETDKYPAAGDSPCRS